MQPAADAETDRHDGAHDRERPRPDRAAGARRGRARERSVDLVYWTVGKGILGTPDARASSRSARTARSASRARAAASSRSTTSRSSTSLCSEPSARAGSSFVAKTELFDYPGLWPADPRARHARRPARRVRPRRAPAHARDGARRRPARALRRGDAPARAASPARRSPARRWSRSRRESRSCRPRSTAPQTGRPAAAARCLVAFGEPMRFAEHPRGTRRATGGDARDRGGDPPAVGVARADARARRPATPRRPRRENAPVARRDRRAAPGGRRRRRLPQRRQVDARQPPDGDARGRRLRDARA